MKNFFNILFISIIIILFFDISLYAQEGTIPVTVIKKKSSSLLINPPDTENVYMPLSEFTFDHDQRYTMDGSLPRLKTKINPTTLEIIGGIYVGAIVGLHIHQTNAWWSGQRRSFHIQEAWAFGYQANIAGHAFGGYVCSYVMSEGLITSGFSVPDATLYGTIFGALYQTYVEVEDGFSKSWGWSPSEGMANLIGPIFFLAQHHVPALQNIQPKWEYVPTEWTGKPNLLHRPKTFIDDYNSSTFWWSVDVYNLLPKGMRKYWLPWLNLAIGYGSDGIDSNPNPNGPPDQEASRRVIIGLDYNLVRLLPGGAPFWNWLRQSLNLIKFPSPAVEFSPYGTRFSLLYPFRFNLGGLRF